MKGRAHSKTKHMSVLKRYQGRSFLISTDLETDDMVALYILSKEIPSENITFLVGEGNSGMKKLRMNKYVKKLGFKNATVIRGFSSEKMFPYDGYDLFSESFINQLNCNKENVSYITKELYSFLKKKSPIIISLKPPRELLKLTTLYTDDIISVFSKCVFFGYMSFNMRCLMKEYNHDHIITFLEAFKECYYYETFHAIGSVNTITDKDIDMKKLPKIVYNVMKDWNRHMVENCNKTCERYKDRKDKRGKAKYHRNKKALEDIQKSKGEQFVNADCGLIMSLLHDNPPYTKHRVEFDEKTGYSKFTQDGKINVIQPIDKSEYRKFQILFLKKLLKC